MQYGKAIILQLKINKFNKKEWFKCWDVRASKYYEAGEDVHDFCQSETLSHK